MRQICDDVIMVNTNNDGPYTHTQPKLVRFAEHTIHVKNWTDAVQQVCEKIAAENQKEFHVALQRIVGNKRPYFSLDSDADYKRSYKIGSTEIYVVCNLDANNAKSLLDAVAQLFGYGEVSVELW